MAKAPKKPAAKKAPARKKAAPKKRGRPSSFTAALGTKICERLALGESLREICRDEKMPPQATVYRWLLSDDEQMRNFREQYAHARELQADSLFEEMKEIADDGSNDWMEKFGRDGESLGWVVNGEAVQRSKLRLDDRKWRASKLKPKKYGDKLDLTSDGERLDREAGPTEKFARMAAIMLEKRRQGLLPDFSEDD